MRVVTDRLMDRRDRWQGGVPHPVPLAFLNGPMALSRTVLGHAVDTEYRWACGFFGLGLVDRTRTLRPGFPLAVTDPIPDEGMDAGIGDLCHARAAEIVAEAGERAIRVMWSGGIDSTAALVALLRVTEGNTGRLEVAFTRDSVREYPAFHELLKKRGVTMRKGRRVRDALLEGAGAPLVVTGEHGDQIFGSMLAEEIDPRDWRRPWRDVMAPRIRERLGKRGGGFAMEALARQGAACPVRAETAFDRLWWWNFSMKWAVVAGRIPASLPDPEERAFVAARLRHFFGTADFQCWALANPDRRIRDTWESYKWPLKDYIFGFTGDADYRDHKCKERSLRALMPRRLLPVAIDANGRRFTQKTDRSLRTEAKGIVVEMCLDGE